MRKQSAVAVVLIGGLLAVGCGKNEPAPQPAPETAQAPTGAAPTVASAPPQSHRPAIRPNTEQAVYSVDNIVLMHPNGTKGAVTIRASGIVRTAGWLNTKLVEVAGVDNRGDIRTYKFVATSPPTPTAERLQRAQAELQVDSLPGSVKTIRVVSQTNEVSAAIPP